MDMLAELREDNMDLVTHLRETHDLCDEHGDVATASLIENWIDEAEQRIWFLFESGRTTALEPRPRIRGRAMAPPRADLSKRPERRVYATFRCSTAIASISS